jgi:hypothetical protein
MAGFVISGVECLGPATRRTVIDLVSKMDVRLG